MSILLLLLIGGVIGAGLVIWLNDKGRSGRDSLMAPPPVSRPGPKPALPLAGAELDEVRALVARGEKIEAIKRVRELTGLGLKEAKELVEGL